MKVKVTDPCYVIDTKEWDRLCNEASEATDGGNDWVKFFRKSVEDYLKDKTESWARAGDTGYGDWSNEMRGKSVITSGFYADAGMWCVVPADFNERDDMDPFGGAAVLEFDDGSYINVEVEELNDGQWTEFSVSGLLNEEYVTNYSLPYRDEEDEDGDL